MIIIVGGLLSSSDSELDVRSERVILVPKHSQRMSHCHPELQAEFVSLVYQHW